MVANAKRISRGRYSYRGIQIVSLGYYPPERHVIWEARDVETGEAFAWGKTIEECTWNVDRELDANK